MVQNIQGKSLWVCLQLPAAATHCLMVSCTSCPRQPVCRVCRDRPGGPHSWPPPCHTGVEGASLPGHSSTTVSRIPPCRLWSPNPHWITATPGAMSVMKQTGVLHPASHSTWAEWQVGIGVISFLAWPLWLPCLVAMPWCTKLCVQSGHTTFMHVCLIWFMDK